MPFKGIQEKSGGLATRPPGFFLVFGEDACSVSFKTASRAAQNAAACLASHNFNISIMIDNFD
ncbi:hypothetical protein C8024_15080 [Sphingopyxis sp. BSNA05]|uniref:hypothetical protein n=1 Tax=Sphingopyxis sp. BSNA05 TaxID=1236614 RepID=UPI0015676A7A|nr:hypothetical protein [Sphingopyxis sp. BSNA05]NRD90501.1 hypothetical protein [Sphingopyxis sp. BSNA05]